MFRRLPPPQEEADKAERDVALVQDIHKARKASIGKVRRKALDKKIQKMVEEHERNTASLRTKLKDLSNFLEGKAEDVDFPFGPEVSSKIDIRLAAAYSRLLRANFTQAVFSDARAFIAVPMPGTKREEINDIEAAVNWTAENASNLTEAMKDTIIPSFRDQVAFIHGQWRRRIEHGCDYKAYYSADDFRADYPNADSADMDQEEYDEIIAYLADPEAELKVEYEIDFIAHNAPFYTVFPLAKFIWAPLYQQRMEDLRLYGFAYTESPEEFERNVQSAYYDKEPAEQSRRKSSSSMADEWEAAREQIEGISSQTSDEVKYKLAYLVISEDLDDDNIPERYVVIWDLEKHRSLRIENYGIRRNIPCIVPYRLLRRDGRLLGSSLLADSEQLFRLVNAIHRHRSNQRRITDSATILFPENLKDKVDLGAEYNYFIPGRAIYLPDAYMRPDMAPRALALPDMSKTNDSVDEESLAQRYVDLVLGTTQGQSGRDSPSDPTAPASKTAMLLQRADIRIEDLVGEWRRSIPLQIDLHRALYYQNAGKDMKIMTRTDTGESEKQVPTKLFADPNIKCVLKPLKPNISPEVEMNKYAALAMAAMQFQFPVQHKPQIMAELWNDYVAASRVERPERFQVQIGQDGQPSMGGQPVDMQGLMGQMQKGQHPLQKPGARHAMNPLPPAPLSPSAPPAPVGLLGR